MIRWHCLLDTGSAWHAIRSVMEDSMKRLYYLTDQLDYAEHISEELVRNGIDFNQIHVLSKGSGGLVTRHLNGLNIFDRLERVRRALNGLLIGLLMAAMALLFGHFGLGLVYSGIAQFALVVLLLLFSTWVGNLVSFTPENVHLRHFHREINAGRYLLMIDVGVHQERSVHSLIDCLNEAQYSGADEQLLS
jgi:hypothetical protein